MRRLLLALLVLMLFVPAATAKTAGKPLLSVGDFWEVQNSGPGALGASNVTSTVLAFEPATAGGVSYDAARTVTRSNLSYSGSGFTTTSETEGVSWNRVSDGAAIRSTSHTRTMSDIPDFPSEETTSESIWEPPCLYLQYPIEPEKTWTSTCRVTTTTSEMGAPAETTSTNTTTTFKVLREERISVLAGTFDTFVLELTSRAEGQPTNATATLWYAPVACSVVKTVTQVEETAYTSELKAYACARGGGSPPEAGPTPSSPVVTTPTTNAPAPTGATPSPLLRPALPGPGLVLVLAALGGALLVRRR